MWNVNKFVSMLIYCKLIHIRYKPRDKVELFILKIVSYYFFHV